MGINWSLFPTANTINIVIIFIIRFLAMQCISYNYPESPTSWLLLGILLQDLAPERAFADFVLCNLVLHLVIINFLGQVLLSYLTEFAFMLWSFLVGIRTCSFEIIFIFLSKESNLFGFRINTVSCTNGDPGLELVRLYPDQSQSETCQ